jgi:hypothetical protein
MVTLLVKLGANLDERTYVRALLLAERLRRATQGGWTPLELARHQDKKDVVEFLTKAAVQQAMTTSALSNGQPSAQRPGFQANKT